MICTRHPRVSGVTNGLKWLPWIQSSIVQIWRRRKTQNSELIACNSSFLFFPLYYYGHYTGKELESWAWWKYWPYMYKTSKQWKTELCPCFHIAWGEVTRGYSLHVPLVFLYQAMQTKKRTFLLLFINDLLFFFCLKKQNILLEAFSWKEFSLAVKCCTK